MIYKCTSCQHETPAGLPPKPAKPEACEKCGAAVTGLHDTLPPPGAEPGAEPEDELPTDGPPLQPDEMPGGTLKGARPKLLISTMLYSLSHELGAAEAEAELHRQIEELSGPFSGERAHDEFLPVAYLIARAMRVFDVGLYVDSGATQIGKARSRAMAHVMKHTEFDVWISVDDDVECTLTTLVALYDAVANGAAAIAIAPCFLRGRPLVNVAFPQVVVDRTLPGSQAKLRTALYGGFGLVALSQEALTRVAAECVSFVDDDGQHKPMAFADVVYGNQAPAAWFGEDLSFFLRVPKSVRVEALMTGHSRHAGETLNLARLEEYETFRPTEAWLAAREALHPSQPTERKVLVDGKDPHRPAPEAESVVDGPA